MGYLKQKQRAESGLNAPMTPAEITRFDEIVAEIQEVVIDSWRRSAPLLLELRDSRGYRRTHTHIEDFCFELWGMTERRIKQLIKSSQNAELCESKMEKPRKIFTSEISSRPLMKVPHGKMAEVTVLCEEAYDDKGILTFQAVEKIVSTVCPQKKKDDVERIKCEYCGGKGWTTPETQSTN